MSEFVLSEEQRIAFQTACKAKGFSDEKIKRMGSAYVSNANVLPAEGTFVFDIDNDIIENEKDHSMNYVQIRSSDNGKISISALMAQCQIVEQGKEIDIVATPDSKWAIKIAAINPDLARMAPDTIPFYLNGKKFKAEKIESVVRPFNREANTYTRFDTEEDARKKALPKTLYKITIVK